MNKKLVLVVAAIGALATTLFLSQAPAPDAQAPLTAATSASPGVSAISAPATATVSTDRLPGAALLVDVDIIGGLSLYSDGSLEYTLALRHLFDHFLSMAGNADNIPATRSALHHYLQSQGLGSRTETEVLSTFEHYTEYLRAAEQVQLNSYEAGDLERTFEVLFSLRRSVLGNRLAEAFFSEDEAREQVIISQRRIAADPHLSAAEREQRYAELEETLPPQLQEARRQATAVARLSQDTAALRQAGASAEVIQQMREQQVGYQAAERLAELDRSRAEWAQRLQAYQHERDTLLSADGYQAADQEYALAQLRDRLFSEQEARRVAALESVIPPTQ